MSINILYPAQIDNDVSIPDVDDKVTPISGELLNRLKAAILAVEEELGVRPAVIYGTVRARLDYLEMLVSGKEVTPPSLGGDLSGTLSAATVIGLYNHPIASTAPVASAVPVWDTTLGHYDVRQLTQDDLAPGFSINSFTGGSIVEIGATISSPSFSATYSSTPTSANITNTDGIDSPLVLSSPFTSGIVVGSFHHASATSVIFTLTAFGSSTKTATQAIAFEARSFGGVGGAGAVSATASGTNAILNSSLGTLASVGLHATDVGQTYGPFTASAQKLYLLMIGSSHVLHDPNTNAVIPCLTPTAVSFTNANGSVVSMFLYESQFLITSTLSALVFQ